MAKPKKQKCKICGQKKGSRPCPAVGDKICSLCCGTKRQKEISCPDTCRILIDCTGYQTTRAVRREISERICKHFRTEKDDIFKRPEVARFAADLELPFVINFYYDEKVNDDDIRNALIKIYANLTGKTVRPRAEKPCEQLIFAIYEKADRNNPGLSDEMKIMTLLRILKSIRDSSGGVLGNKNYLEMVRHQSLGTGPFAQVDD